MKTERATSVEDGELYLAALTFDKERRTFLHVKKHFASLTDRLFRAALLTPQNFAEELEFTVLAENLASAWQRKLKSCPNLRTKIQSKKRSSNLPKVQTSEEYQGSS